VTIADPLTIPQARLIEEGLEVPAPNADGKYFLSALDVNQLPAVFACVEKWELSNMPEKLTADNFPASPRKDSHLLIEWVFREIMKVYTGELEIPNA
jgi:hypothetical protein